jgi:hypothetical protein
MAVAMGGDSRSSTHARSQVSRPSRALGERVIRHGHQSAPTRVIWRLADQRSMRPKWRTWRARRLHVGHKVVKLSTAPLNPFQLRHRSAMRVLVQPCLLFVQVSHTEHWKISRPFSAAPVVVVLTKPDGVLFRNADHCFVGNVHHDAVVKLLECAPFGMSQRDAAMFEAQRTARALILSDAI